MADESGLTTARQFAMLQAIPRAPLKASSTEIEARLRDEGFAVSRRTIERDLHTLSLRFPLQLDDRAKPYGWSWAKDASFAFMPRLNASQAVALLLARAHMQKLLPQTLHKELLPVFEAAEHALAASGWKDWHRRTAVLPTGLWLQPPKMPSGVLPAVQSALARKHVLSAQYRSKGSRETRPMAIHPLGLLARGPVLYLVCTLFDYSDVRQLAVHRLSASVVTDEPAKQPEGFDFQRYAKEVAPKYQSNGPVKLVAHFDPAAAEHLLETPLSADQTWRELDNGKVEVTAIVEDDETLRWWLLGFGSMVEAVQPTQLRQDLINDHVESIVQYQVQGPKQ